MTEEKLLALAEAGKDEKEQRGRFCEAWYFLEMLKLLGGDRDAAASYFRKSIATDQ